MNRNYLPPALKLPRNNSGSLSQSPPNACGGHTYLGGTHYNTSTISSPYPTAASPSMGNQSTLPLAPASSATSVAASYPSRRIYGKACKLPPVQEVGKFFSFYFEFNFIII